MGFMLHPLSWRRGSINPRRSAWRSIGEVRALYRALTPDLVHHVALQPAIIGSLAASGLPLTRLNALAGLGFAFTSRSAKARLAAPGPRRAVAASCSTRPHAAVLVQNPDDRAAVGALGVARIASS